MAWKKPDDEGLNFNKDLACLQEIQRLENVYANAFGVGSLEEAFRCLVLISGKIKPKLGKNDKDKVDDFKKSCFVIKKNNYGREQKLFDSSKIDEFYEFVNEMLVTHQIHLNKVQSSMGATDV